jgi:DNA repair protein SbcC/Rad50
MFENNLHKVNTEKISKLSRIQGLKNDVFTIDEKIKQYYLKEQDILFNETVNLQIIELQGQTDVLKVELSELYTKLHAGRGEIVRIDTMYEQLLSEIKKIHDLEIEHEAYTYYLDAVKRDGIPYELIKQSLPIIETAINDILAQIVDFGVVLNMDGKNINAFIAYDESNYWPLELSSGMERFVASLAIRVGLIDVCNLPRNNSLFLDEGFGNLDAENLNTLQMAFQFLKMQFPFVAIISHLESMRDMVDNYLEISKEDGFSKVRYE